MTGTMNQHITKKAGRLQLPAKKHKVTLFASERKTEIPEKKQWLQDIKLSNSFSALTEETATDPTERPTTRIAKPPPIYVDAKIIDLSLNC